MCPDFPNRHRLSLELAQWAPLYACRNPCAITPVEFLDVSRANLTLPIREGLPTIRPESRPSFRTCRFLDRIIGLIGRNDSTGSHAADQTQKEGQIAETVADDARPCASCALCNKGKRQTCD